MTHQHPLIGVRAKIDRAKRHTDELDRELKAFRQSDPYLILPEEDPQTGEIVHRLSLKRIPEAWGTIVGDTIHNLRSSLDLLANQLVRVNGNSPTNRTRFPISKTRNGFYRHGLNNINGAHPKAIKVVERLKPYQGGNAMLWALHALDIRDKHELLIPVVAALAGSFIRQGGMRFGVAGFRSHVHDGSELGRIPSTSRHLAGQMKYEFGFQILLDYGPIERQKPVVIALREFVHFTERLVNIFDRHCL